MAASVSIDGDVMTVVMHGLDKLWSMKSQLDIPLAHVRGAAADPAIVHESKGWRGPGSNVPGVLTAGTFHQHGELIFWDVHRGDNAVVIDLEHEHFERLVIEVDDPLATVQLIERAIAGRAGSADR
ncbi:MAG TPA: hypothetical protein VGL75_02260 [Acidothermaceae bacterium]